MKTRIRATILLASCVTALAAAGAGIDLPAMPVGGKLRGQFTLTANGKPLSDIRVTLTPLKACATFDGRSSIDVTTDPTGTASFELTAGTTRGACVIEGRNGTTVAHAATTIYRPADLKVAEHSNYRYHHREMLLGTSVIQLTSGVSLVATAVDETGREIGLDGLPVSAEVIPDDNGASGALTVVDSVTRPSNEFDSPHGRFDLRLTPNGKVGIYDLRVTVAGETRLFRIEQVADDFSPATIVRRLDSVPLTLEPITASLFNAPAGCVIYRGSYDDGDTWAPPNMPDGMSRWLDGGLLVVDFRECMQTFQLHLLFTHDIPPGSTFFQLRQTVNDVGNWISYPTVVDGHSATVTIDPARAQNPVLDSLQVFGGLAVPGPYVPAAPLNVKDMWWSGLEENGWGMAIMQSGDRGKAFPVLFAYDDRGNPSWWSTLGSWDRSRRRYDAAMLHPRGTPFYAYDKDLFVLGDSPGKGVIAFTDADHATFDYRIDGRTGHKTLQRQVFAAPSAPTAPDVGGMWWGGYGQYGWGISVAQQAATLFAVWFTYDDRGYPTWLVMPGGQWTATNTYEGRIYRTHNAAWLGQAYVSSGLQVTDVGSYRFRFSGTTASFDYTVEGHAGTLALQRQDPF